MLQTWKRKISVNKFIYTKIPKNVSQNYCIKIKNFEIRYFNRKLLYAGFFEFWKRIGVVGFASAVKVSNKYGDLYSSFDDFHLAVGAGLRYMLNIKQRLNVSMDFAVGLDKNAGQGSRPSGLYFDLGEAF